MKVGNVRLIFLKEVRDTLRDRRTLFISIILPILLYPLLMIGFSQVMLARQTGIWERSQSVALTGATGVAGEKLRARLAESEDRLEIVLSNEPGEDLRVGVIDAWVELRETFSADIAERRQPEVDVHFDSSKDASSAAERKIRRVLAAYAKEVLRERELSEADIVPVVVNPADAATVTQRGAKLLGPTLALLLVIMALSGAFYPAVDIMAGEKERGTMETLLVCPATRTEIVVGKYLTVLAMTLVTVLLNFASMALTFSAFAKLVPQGANGGIALTISPMVGAAIVLALLPLAALFSAIALSLSTFARSYKEGQHYLTPLFVAVLPLAMVAMVPETRLSTFAPVPVAGAVLLVRDLLLGSATFGQIVIVLLSTGICAALAIRWTVVMFNREEVLFRDPGGTQFTLFSRNREPGGTATPGQATVVAAISLVLIVFVVPRFPGGAAGGFLFQQVGMVLGFGLLAAWWYRIDLKETFSLRVPRATAWPAVLVGAPSLLLILMWAFAQAGIEEESFEELRKVIEELKATLGLPLLILLPPIAEEFLFRGLILSAFRSRYKPIVAVILAAGLFAVFHLQPGKYLATGLIGVWLGYVVIATRSLYPAIFAHLLNNGLLFLSEKQPLLGIFEAIERAPAPVVLGAAVLGLAASIYLLERTRRAGAAPRGA